MRKSLPFVSLLVEPFYLLPLLQPNRPTVLLMQLRMCKQQGVNWSFLRKLNLQTGEYSQVLLSGNDAFISGL